MIILEKYLSILLLRDELKLAPFESKSWPHLVGKPVDEAIEEIRRENLGKTTFLCLDEYCHFYVQFIFSAFSLL